MGSRGLTYAHSRPAPFAARTRLRSTTRARRWRDLSRLSFSASRFSGDIVYELASPSRANARGLDLLRCWLRIMVQLTDPQFSASAPIYQAIRISATPRALRARYRCRGIDRRSRAEVSTARPHSRHQPRTVAGRRRMVTPPGFAASAGPGGCRACGSLPETHHRWFRLYRVAEPRRFTRDERQFPRDFG